MVATCKEIYSVLLPLVKTAPFLCVDGEWRQKAWNMDYLDNVTVLDAPLCFVKVYAVYFVVKQERFNGWVGTSYFLHAWFDETQEAKTIANYLHQRLLDKIKNDPFNSNPVPAGS